MLWIVCCTPKAVLLGAERRGGKEVEMQGQITAQVWGKKRSKKTTKKLADKVSAKCDIPQG